VLAATIVATVFSFCVELAVESVFVGQVPIGEDDHPRRQALSLSSVLGISDVEINIVPILEPFIKPELKAVGPFRIVLDDGFEVIEELAVGVHTRNLDVGAGVLNKIPLEEGNSFQPFEAGHQSVKRGVNFNELLKNPHFHWPVPRFGDGELRA
jgi:hypothetical protein